MSSKTILLFVFILSVGSLCGQAKKVYPGADEKSPSRAQYFSWINNCNEGATEAQTLINLDFFQWMRDEYGMILDIYAFDAGAIDGKRFYGSTKSDRFKKQFPNHFDKIYEKAKSIDTRLGVWGGPDGFGDTQAEEDERIEQMVSLARDYDFELFKFDGVCGELRAEKQAAFVKMMTAVRKHSPDLILLDHRLDLGIGKPHATTFLWEGAETYIDVHMANNTTAPHHRAAALDRGHTPEYKRLAEDHGVCLSSCLDRWDDELIMQAFNRSLILAPEIYANPWLLRDDEYYKLARIYNLHRKYSAILVEGKPLPKHFGPNAMSRGSKSQRFITMTNLSWQTKTVQVTLDEEIGLTEGSGQVQVRRYHPTESLIGNFSYGQIIDVEILPFRSTLIYAGSIIEQDYNIAGIAYITVKDNDEEIVLKLLSMGNNYKKVNIKFHADFDKIELDGVRKLKGHFRSYKPNFKRRVFRNNYHRKLRSFKPCDMQEDAEALYEATVFSADNNALEVRSLERSGWSEIPQVRKAQEAFFNQSTFVEKAIWDKNLFDKDTKTGFAVNRKWNIEQRVKGGCLRIDMGAVFDMDVLRISLANEYDMQPQLIAEGNWIETSTDLVNWTRETYITGLVSDIKIKEPLRYVRIPYAPQRIVEIEGFKNGEAVDTDSWRASNLFAHAEKMKPQKMWTSNYTPQEVPPGSYLCIALEGKHGIEGAYAAAKINGKYYGCPDRAVSYPSNTWEYINAKRDSNYTYYLPVTEDMIDHKIEIFVMAYDDQHLDIKPELYITTHEIPYLEKTLVLKK